MDQPHQLGSALSKVTSTLTTANKRGISRLGLGIENRVHLLSKDREWSKISAPLVKVLHSCIDGKEPWPLLIHGPPGTGKTCAALCVLDLAQGEYFTVADYCEQHNEAKAGRLQVSNGGQIWRPTPFSFRARFIDRPPLIVLDELGARQQVTDAHYEAVKFAIDLRENRPFIVISNVKPEQIGAMYDARIFSRLAAGTVIEVAGPDRRLE